MFARFRTVAYMSDSMDLIKLLQEQKWTKRALVTLPPMVSENDASS